MPQRSACDGAGRCVPCDEHAKPLRVRRPLDLEPELLAEPALERLGAEVLRHHEPGGGIHLETGKPLGQHRVQFLLAHADRGVRPDGGEPHVDGNIVGEYDLNPSETLLRIKTEDLNAGIYFYTLYLDNESVMTRKLIVKK